MLALSMLPNRTRPIRARWPCCSKWNWLIEPSFLPADVSGGERQRAAVARALANDPKAAARRRAHRQSGLRERHPKVLGLIIAHARKRGSDGADRHPQSRKSSTRCDRYIALKDGALSETGPAAKDGQRIGGCVVPVLRIVFTVRAQPVTRKTRTTTVNFSTGFISTPFNDLEMFRSRFQYMKHGVGMQCANSASPLFRSGSRSLVICR
jgi:hypothetical protein